VQALALFATPGSPLCDDTRAKPPLRQLTSFCVLARHLNSAGEACSLPHLLSACSCHHPSAATVTGTFGATTSFPTFLEPLSGNKTFGAIRLNNFIEKTLVKNFTIWQFAAVFRVKQRIRRISKMI
jgi:hypothetical protein